MLVRYKEIKGRRKSVAKVYEAHEHHLSKKAIDPRALGVVERLQRQGFETYIVGGAVRDLLWGREPKDFDIVTSATPSQVKRIIRPSFIIGRRFKLVLARFGTFVVEIATFRAADDGPHANRFGSIDEDVMRRDYSVNALFYDPIKNHLIDYVGAVADIKNRNLRFLLDPIKGFEEDPVRVIRGLKYATLGGLKIRRPLMKQLKAAAPLLSRVSRSRMKEEILKIMNSSDPVGIWTALYKAGALAYILPAIAHHLQDGSRRAWQEWVASIESYVTARDADKLGKEGWVYALSAPILKAKLDALLVIDDVLLRWDACVSMIKELYAPLEIENVMVYASAEHYLSDLGCELPRKSIRTPRMRGNRAKATRPTSTPTAAKTAKSTKSAKNAKSAKSAKTAKRRPRPKKSSNIQG